MNVTDEAVEAALDSACLSYRHDFGLLPEQDRETLRRTAKWWLEAWQKALPHLSQGAVRVSAPLHDALQRWRDEDHEETIALSREQVIEVCEEFRALSPRVVTDEVDGGWLIHKAGRGWYRPNAQGYTNDTAQAGRYSHEDAHSYSHPNGWDGPRDGITIKHESELQSLRTAALSSAEEKEGPEVVAFLVDCPTQPTLEFANVHVPDSAEPLVRQSALTACQQEVERLRGERNGMVHEVAYRHAVARAETAKARNAELVKALEASRQVLAKLLSAGHNSPPATPEEIDAAFWSVDAALGGQSYE